MWRYIIWIAIFHSFVLSAQDNQAYSFFIAGHTYGQPGVNNIGLYPPFKSKFDYIQNRSEIQFGIFTGDIVSPNPIAKDWDEIDIDIERLGLPIYFAVGNHDMENRPLFESRYGETYYSFEFNKDLYIVLDPNLDHWNISGEQLAFLNNLLQSKAAFVDNIFVFFHQVLWWANDNKYQEINPNSLFDRSETINFWSEIIPLFNQLSNLIIMCSGDFGATQNGTEFMYDRFGNITLIGSGMGNGKGDNFIIINVDSDKNISYDLICLSKNELNCFGDLEDYQISTVVEEVQASSMKICPNPAYSKIKIIPNIHLIDVEIYNTFGQLVLVQTVLTQEEIDISDLIIGIYFVKIGDQFIKLLVR